MHIRSSPPRFFFADIWPHTSTPCCWYMNPILVVTSINSCLVLCARSRYYYSSPIQFLTWDILSQESWISWPISIDLYCASSRQLKGALGGLFPSFLVCVSRKSCTLGEPKPARTGNMIETLKFELCFNDHAFDGLSFHRLLIGQ